MLVVAVFPGIVKGSLQVNRFAGMMKYSISVKPAVIELPTISTVTALESYAEDLTIANCLVVDSNQVKITPFTNNLLYKFAFEVSVMVKVSSSLRDGEPGTDFHKLVTISATYAISFHVTAIENTFRVFWLWFGLW